MMGTGDGTHVNDGFMAGKHEARLDAIAGDVTEIKQTLREALDSHERRLQRLERWRAGLVATITLVSSYLGVDKLFHFK